MPTIGTDGFSLDDVKLWITDPPCEGCKERKAILRGTPTADLVIIALTLTLIAVYATYRMQVK